ncbi:LemA family protein [Candidatus Wolfebacteria bacterium]|nr:LemA family protein [Candidatus Wolfebacteria bacterium]
MFWNFIWGVIIVLLLAGGLFDAVAWQLNIWLIGGAVLLWAVSMYNHLVRLRVRVKEGLSDIDVQLKRRFNLIPNLVESVKGYMGHEKNVLESVTQARTAVSKSDGDPLKRAEAENQLSSTLKTLFAVSENYPDLKANANFLDLQRELADTENKIQAARRFYNGMVREMNTEVNTLPSNVIAKMFGFKEEKFFEVESAEEKEVVKVKF